MDSEDPRSIGQGPDDSLVEISPGGEGFEAYPAEQVRLDLKIRHV